MPVKYELEELRKLPLALKPEQVLPWLNGIGRSAFYSAIRAGQVPHYRIGSRIRIPRAWLEQVLSGEEVA